MNKLCMKLSLLFLTFSFVSACSSLDKVKDVNLWPFVKGDNAPRVYKSANSTEYVCEKGKKFYVRTLDNGGNVWLMLSDRELLLPRVGAEKVYSNGIIRLDMTRADVSLEANADNRYIGCKEILIK